MYLKNNPRKFRWEKQQGDAKKTERRKKMKKITNNKIKKIKLENNS